MTLAERVPALLSPLLRPLMRHERAVGGEIPAFGGELVAAYRRNTAPRAAVLALQAQRLEALVAVARCTRAYAGLTRFADAPVVDKAALMARFEEHLVGGAPTRAHVQAFLHSRAPASLLDDRFLVATTSGTTGEVGVFVVDDVSFARLRATVFARIFRDQLRPEGFALLAKRRYRMSFVVALGGHTMTSVLALRAPKAAAAVADVRVYGVDEPLARLVAQLNDAPPLLLHSYATHLEVLAHEALRGRLRIAPEIVTAGSEPLTESARLAIRGAFPRARLVETWGATEHVALATSCPLGHLHVNEDAAVLEGVDDDGAPVVDGAWADHVLVTNLLNHTQPILRYRLDDRVRLHAADCACGSPFRRVEIVGRSDDVIYLDDGAAFQSHTPIPFELLLLGTPGLLQFALVHEEQNRLRLSVVVEEGADAARVCDDVCARVDGYLADHGLADRVSYVVDEIATLARHHKSKKLRQITSRVPRPTPRAGRPIVAAASARRERP